MVKIFVLHLAQQIQQPIPKIRIRISSQIWYLGKGTSMYYVIKILGFLAPPPPPFVITFSTERNQKLPFSAPSPFVIT